MNVDPTGDAPWAAAPLQIAVELAGEEFAVSPHQVAVTLLPSTGGGRFDSLVVRLAGPTDSLIAKIVAGSGGQPGADDREGHREIDLYRSEALDRWLPDGLRRPRCLATLEFDEAGLLVLEDAGTSDPRRRDGAWYGTLASLLGRLNGCRAAATASPPVGSTDLLEREIGRALPRIEAATAPQPHTTSPLFSAAVRQWIEDTANTADHRLAHLNAGPHGFGHLDAFSRNVELVGDDFVLFDWAMAGTAPIGVEPAGSILHSAIHLDLPLEQLDAIEAEVLASYRDGLASAGLVVETRSLRAAYDHAVALRFLSFLASVHAVLGSNPAAVERIVGADIDEVVSTWVGLAAHVIRHTH